MNKLILILLTTISISAATDYFDTCTAGVMNYLPGAIIPDTIVLISYESNSGNACYNFEQRIEIFISGNERKLNIGEYLDSATEIEHKIRIKSIQEDSCINCNKITQVLNIIYQSNFSSLKCVSDASSGGCQYCIYCKFGKNIHSIHIEDEDNSIKQKEYVILKDIFNNKNLFKFSKYELSKKYTKH
jgi:hypothetical protein